MRYDLESMKRVILTVALAAMTGCPSYAKFQPVTVTAPVDAFDKATRVLIERGETIETKDQSAGILLTKWEESTQMGTDRRYRWSVTIANGSATVNSQCQIKMGNGPLEEKKWEDCEGTQSTERTTGARQIADAIAR